jgi:hypothetical protein
MASRLAVGADCRARRFPGQDGGLEPELDPAPVAGVQPLHVQEDAPGHHLRGAHVHTHALALLQAPLRVQDLDADRQHPARFPLREGHQRLPAGEGIGVHSVAGERDGRPMAGLHHVHLLSVYLQPPDAGPDASRLQLHPVPDGEPTGPQRPGDHRPGPPDGEDPVHREHRHVVPVVALDPPGDLEDRPAEGLDPRPGDGGGGDDGRLRMGPTGQEVPDIVPRELEPLLFHQVGLGQGHDEGPDAQEPEDGVVLASLGHDPFVGGDHQDHHVHPRGPREHVPDEALVPRHVHDPEAQFLVVELGEPQVDRDPPLLLLGEAIGVDAGERPDQRRLPMVDVTCGPQDEATHPPGPSAAPHRTLPPRPRRPRRRRAGPQGGRSPPSGTPPGGASRTRGG